ncbi:uncharacterized protein LOC124188419 isoform X1 [Daphnia pulex]|uniref:uncharacterized protein LOC124188419 isoform X1 n=1 Tax=Daphnia pulex TaxID=6669 RepID=UPI001EDEAF0B|nr:uncharacterized protein LOC124188419 isoform X1 [Daphnia pulex]
MVACFPLTRHFISHVEFVIIWFMIVLKISDYWVETGGSEFLPAKWIYYSKFVDQTYQKSFACIGLSCSTVLSYSILVKRICPLWNIALGSLWISMLFLISPIWKTGVSFILCIVASIKIISELPQRKSKQACKSKMIKVESSHMNLSKSPNPPCDLDLSKLDIGSPRKTKTSTPSISSIAQSPGFAKPRPLISPSRLSSSSIIRSSPETNLTKASWVAGGYWQGNNWPAPTFSSPSHNTALTRSSSQSSGFGSIQTGLLNRSPPDSRPDSTLEDIDRFSVFSDNLDQRFTDSSLRYQENSPCLYQYPNNELSRKSLISSISSTNDSVHHISTIPSTTQWSWIPFMFGFSLAVNVCVLTYFVFLHSSKIGGVL